MTIAATKRPPGTNKITHKPLGFIGIHKTKPQQNRWCACNYAFLGLSGLFGWVHLGMVHRCLTTDSCHGADAAHARCARGASTPTESVTLHRGVRVSGTPVPSRPAVPPTPGGEGEGGKRTSGPHGDPAPWPSLPPHAPLGGPNSAAPPAAPKPTELYATWHSTPRAPIGLSPLNLLL